MRLFHKTNIDFMGPRKRWYMISLSIIVIGMISLAFKGVDYGIDFAGGTEVLVEFSQAPNVSDIRSMMGNAGFAKNEIKKIGRAHV